MSATVISIEDFQKAAEEVANHKRRPVSVIVSYSESREFESGEQMSFDEFERRAYAVALDNAGSGYDKTGVEVSFDDGDSYSCRIDLKAGDEMGFTDHCLQMIEFSESPRGRDYYKNHGTEDLLNFVKQIIFDNANNVFQQRETAADAVRLADEARKAEAERSRVAAAAARAAEVERLKTAPEYEHLTQGASGSVEVAKNIRKDLKKHFHGCKFSVRKDGYNSIYISWTDGPAKDAVDPVCNRYQAGHFDGMSDDCYDYHSSPFNDVFGGVMYISTSRTLSPEAREQLNADLVDADPDEVWRESLSLSHNGQEWEKPKADQEQPAKPHFKAVLRGLVWVVAVTHDNRSESFAFSSDSILSAMITAWALFNGEPEPTPPGTKEKRESQPAEPQNIKQPAATASGELVSEPLQMDLFQFYSTAAAALSVECFNIIRQHDGSESENVAREVFINAVGQNLFTVEPESHSITRFQSDSVCFQLSHNDNCLALVQAAIAEQELNQNIDDGYSESFSDAVARYDERIEGKRDRLEYKADKANSESNSRYSAAKSAASMIPFGQPILVGHHSEKRDRNFRSRINANFDRAFELAEQADKYKERAARIGTGGISSDDPAAILKLVLKLGRCELSQQMMKTANSIIRRCNKDSSLNYIEIMAEAGFSENIANEIREPDHCGRIGFAAYSLQNNNAEIKRLRTRIKSLVVIKSREQDASEPTQHGPAQKILEDGRICFKFDGKPDDDIRTILKSNGFKWAPSRKLWVRKSTANGLYAAALVAKELEKLG